ncbi:MAG: tyrosine-type recombinase/integrase [Pseudobdellovibrio sp.]
MGNLIVKEDLAVNVSSLISAFLSGRKATTINAYKQDLTDFANYVKATDINEAASRLFNLSQGEANLLVLQFKNYLVTEKQLSSATVNRRLAAIRSLSQLARTLGIVSWSLEIENQKNQAYRDTRGIGIEAVNKIISYLKSKNDHKSIRDLAILRLLFDLGLRRNEVCTIDIEDISISNSTINILSKGKTQKECLNLPASTLEAIQNWINIRSNSTDALFYRLDKASSSNLKRLTGSGLYVIITELGAKLGLHNLSVHKFRHSAITACCEVIKDHNLGLETLVKFSRHSSLNTALLYMDHLENKQKTLSDLVSKKV